jgi:hypothetical protein
MIVKNKLDQSFGPVGSFAGKIIFFAGICMTYFYFSGIFLIMIGAFVGFTATSTRIDYDKKKIKFSNNIFGIIPTGKWVYVESNMKIGIIALNQTFSAYSRGNRPLDIVKKDYRLVLYDSDNQEIMPVKKAVSPDAAKTEREEIGNKFGIVMI